MDGNINGVCGSGPVVVRHGECGRVTPLGIVCMRGALLGGTVSISEVPGITLNGTIRIVAVADPIDLGFEIAGNLKIRIDLKKTDQVL